MTMKELLEERNQVAADMRALHDSVAEDQSMTSEQRTQWDEARSKLERLDEQIEREKELRKADQLFVEDRAGDNVESEARSGDGEGGVADISRRAFAEFVRRGLGDMDAELREAMREMRAQAAGVDDRGGYTVPPEFRARVVESMQAYGGVASIAQVIETDGGNTIEWATTDGTSEEGELIGENAAATEDDVLFGTGALGAKKLSSKIIRVSMELLSDSGVDIESLLTSRIAQRIGRAESRLLVQGSGAGTPVQPRGLAASVTQTHTAASATGISYSDLLRLKHSVDIAYRVPTSRYLFNDSTFLLLKELTDGQGRPLWKPDLPGVSPATIDGSEFQIDNAVADVGAGARSVYFGDFNRFILRRVRHMAIKRLVERYAEYDQVGFLAFHRFDCVLEDLAAISALSHA